MSEFRKKYTVQFLPFRKCLTDAFSFETRDVMLDPMRDTAESLKDNLGVRAIVVHNAKIVARGQVMKNWLVEATPLVVLECAPSYEESDAWESNPNQVARVLMAQIPIDAALIALSRAFWQGGFREFSVAASFLRDLVDRSGAGSSYQRRMDMLCMNLSPIKHLTPLAPFNEFTGEVMFPPLLRGNIKGGQYMDEWVDVPLTNLSQEMQQRIQDTARKMSELGPHLSTASRAVVRVFGYHSAEHDGPLGATGTRVVPFTGFFVSPKLILSTRTAKYSEQHQTFAHKYAFTSRVRAIHGMLTPGVDLFECTEVPGVNEYLIDSIRRLGVSLEETKVPPGFFAVEWNDWLLLEVTDPSHYNQEYLLPECDASIQKGEQLLAIQYSERPTDEWIEEMCGNKGHNFPLHEDVLRRHFWHYDTKCCSVGQALSLQEHGGHAGHGDCYIAHTCSLLPGSRGCPIFRHVSCAEAGGASTYVGISIGRATDEYTKERENIISMSTSDIARVESLGCNIFNEGAGVTHVALLLLYTKFIQSGITNEQHRLYLLRFLDRYKILSSPDVLSSCHRKMLKDADDYNEYGMDFYDHHDLNSALSCFREGARMFSTATIPNLSEYELELRNALQTNVSAVVVAKLV